MTRSRLPSFLVGCLTLLAAALQLWALQSQSLWYDEGFSVWLSRQSPAAIIGITAADIQPPFYYLLLNVWMHLTGQSEYALRFLSAWFAVLCVPLMWQAVRRWLHDTPTAFIAATLVAVSPLWLWYGREARNYALVLACLLGAAWALAYVLRPTVNRATWRGAWVVALLLTVALYTHYFALFVVGAWGLVVGLYALGHYKTHLRPIAVALGVPVVVYVPWVGVMFTRLGEDRSYWEGQLDVRDALEKTFASWMVGHSFYDEPGRWVGYIGVGLAVLGIIVLAWHARHSERARLNIGFWVTWLVVPVLGFLLVAIDRPKFNARYLIFATPAFLVLLAVVGGWLWRRARIVGVVGVAALVALFLFSDNALYYNPDFAKADWRGVAAYLRDHRATEEPVVLVSGHTFPMLDYYAPDLQPLLLPPKRTLDTTAILGVDTGETLAEALQGASGVWLINWQDEVVDPEAVVPAIINDAGATVETTPLFREVRLSHWMLAPDTVIPSVLTPQHPLNVRYGDALTLQGWSSPTTLAPVDSGLPIQLFWAAQQPLIEDYKVRVRVVDENGFEYGIADQRPTAYNLPTFRWQAGETRLGVLDIPLMPGTMAGSYWLDVFVYQEGQGATLDILDASNAPQGRSTRIGPIALLPPTDDWDGGRPPADAVVVNAEMGQGVRLAAVRPPELATVERGRRVPFMLWWQTDDAVPNAIFDMEWLNGGAVIARESVALGNADYQGLPEGLVMTPLLLRVPQEAVGDTELRVRYQGNDPASTIWRVTVEESNRTFTPPIPQTAQSATFSDQLRLLGYDLTQTAEGATLTLHWEVLRDVDKSYTAFVHILDANGVLIPNAGQDKLPLDGARPTDTWVSGEYISDTFTLIIPTAGYATPYQIEVGWYDAQDPTFPRLFATGDGADGNRVLLQGVTLP